MRVGPSGGGGGFGLTFKCKVESLSRKISDNIDDVPAPERQESLLPVHSGETVHDPLVSLVSCDPLVSVLDLKQHLDSLQRSHHRLTDGRRDSAGHKVEDEILAHDYSLEIFTEINVCSKVVCIDMT